MNKFKVGDHVRMLPSGVFATISEVNEGSKYTTYGVVFMGHTMWGSADAYELANAATAPTAAAQGEVVDDDDDEPLELSVHRFIPGLWRVTHVDGVASMELVAEEATDPNEVIRKHLDANKFLDAIKAHRKMYGSGLREAKEAVEAMQYNRPTYAELAAALQQAQRERDAANELLAKIERRMPMVQPFDLGAHYYSETYNAWLVGDWIRAYQTAASAQQAANAEGGA